MGGETHREGLRSTNLAAIGGLNIIACLALAPKELEAAWRRVRTRQPAVPDYAAIDRGQRPTAAERRHP